MKVLMLNRYGRKGASSRLRSLQFLPWFARAGIDCEVHALFSDELLAQRYERGQYSLNSLISAYSTRLTQLLRHKHFDLLWVEKEALPWMPASLEQALLGSTPYVLDYDDAIFHQYDSHASRWIRTTLGKRIDKLMRSASLVTCGNAYLAQRARVAGARRIEVVPTVIDLDHYALQPGAPRPDTALRLAWIGSPSTAPYLDGIRNALERLGQAHAFELHVIGAPGFTLKNVQVHSIEWSESTEVGSLRACDIGVMPLVDGPWERGKCGYKLIQYMACGLPVVGSAVGVNTEIIRDGENGYLARHLDDWVRGLSTLMQDATLRERFGAAGRRRVEDEYCVQRTAPRLVQLLQQARAAA